MRCLALLVLLLAAAPARPAVEASGDRFPELASSYAVLVDDQLLWARALDAPRSPASLVKLLTALELLSASWDSEAIVRVSARADAVVGAQAGLRAGERLRARDLLTAMLVRSANDACMALVEHAAGDPDNFADRLNRRARVLGMQHSLFVHPCGLEAPGQHTTARDLILLGRAASADRDIALRGRAVSAEIETLAGRRILLRNTNLLLDRELGVVGLKTGYTRRAGDCLIALAERGERRVMIVLLDSTNRWWGAGAALEQAFLHAAITVNR